MKKLVLHPKSTSAQLPLTLTAVLYLLFDKFHVRGVYWGVAGTLLFLVYAVIIYSWVSTESITLEEIIDGVQKKKQ